MGLDMYLFSRKEYFHRDDAPAPKDAYGFPITEIKSMFGYWRKHHKLNDFIMHHFAKPMANCEEIYLEPDGLRKIIAALTEQNLSLNQVWYEDPSAPEARMYSEATINAFKTALHFLTDEEKLDEYGCQPYSKTVFYYPSW